MARIALCQDVMMEYMGYMSISAFLKKAGHSVEVFIDRLGNASKLVAELKAYQPDIVGFSVLSPSVKWALEAGKRVKAEIGALTVYGNVQVIFNPEMIEAPGVDIICRGEGEFPMQELAECIDRHQPYSHIRGFWVKTSDGIVKNELPDNLVDLEQLPFYDRRLYDKYRYFRSSTYLQIALGRGCPNSCAFCSNPALAQHYGRKRYLRKQSPARAIAELEYQIRQRKRVKYILFMDEVFWVQNEWLREFLQLYKERIGIRFGGNFRFGPIEERDIQLMAEAGADTMVLATETGDEHERQMILNKHVSNESIFQVAEWLRKYHIRYSSSLIFGLPGDAVAKKVSMLDFYRKVRAQYVWTAFFQPYSGIALAESDSVRDALPPNKDFGMSLHHDIYLNLPEQERLTRLKKIYFLCVIWPKGSPFLLWLTQFRVPLLFDALFLCHFSYYSFRFVKVSLFQFLLLMQNFGFSSLMTKIARFFPFGSDRKDKTRKDKTRKQ